MLGRLATLLASLKLELQTWFAQAPTTNPDDVLEDLPPGFMAYLLRDIQTLPVPQPYQHAIREALGEALQAWQAQPETSNSLVILGSPVDAIAPILNTCLTPPFPADWTESWLDSRARLHIRVPLAQSQRPDDPLSILSELREALDREKLEALEELEQQDAELEPDDDAIVAAIHSEPEDGPISAFTNPTIVVIPNLERCFLRCIQGWEGVEYLQNLITHDSSYFWVLGCSSWTWAFLDRVCQISAYLEQVELLPTLTGEDLQGWLSPLMQTVAAPKDAEAPESDLELGSDAYWHALASASSGIGATAAHLWVQSLRIRTEDLTEHEREMKTNLDTQISRQLMSRQLMAQQPWMQSIWTNPTGTMSTLREADANADTDADANNPHHLRPIKPSLPTLMDLESMDRYILHSLLLHGRMTRSHLALSLGEAEQTIRPRVQVLRRDGVIIQQGVWLWVHPAHYPKLRSELGNNSFLVGKA